MNYLDFTDYEQNYYLLGTYLRQKFCYVINFFFIAAILIRYLHLPLMFILIVKKL